jgi:hypothetical protein
VIFIGGLVTDKVEEEEVGRFAFAVRNRKKGEKENFE